MKYIIAWNIVVFLLYGFDKQQAKKRHRRVRERTLLFCAFTMGAAGAMAGMQVFRHKTKHKKFKILVPLYLLLNGIVLFGPNVMTQFM